MLSEHEAESALVSELTARGSMTRGGAQSWLVSRGASEAGAIKAVVGGSKKGLFELHGDAIMAKKNPCGPCRAKTHEAVAMIPTHPVRATRANPVCRITHKVAKGKLSTKSRESIPSCAFADPKNRRFPIHDLGHARAAIPRLGAAYKKGHVSEAEYKKIRGNIESALKRFGHPVAITKPNPCGGAKRSVASHNPAKTTVDSTAAHELELYIENESSIYNQKKSIIENIKRKMQRGVYQPALAPKLWLYWVDAGAKKYVKEFGSGRVDSVFNKATREHVARSLAKDYEQRIRGGEYGPVSGASRNPVVKKTPGQHPETKESQMAKAKKAKKRSGKGKKRRTAAQKAATKKMIAANKRRGRGKSKSKPRKHPKTHATKPRARKRAVAHKGSAPRKRAVKRTGKKVVHRKRHRKGSSSTMVMAVPRGRSVTFRSVGPRRNPIDGVKDIAISALSIGMGFGLAELADRYMTTKAHKDSSGAEVPRMVGMTALVARFHQNGWRRFATTGGLTVLLGLGARFTRRSSGMHHLLAAMTVGAGIKVLSQLVHLVLPQIIKVDSPGEDNWKNQLFPENFYKSEDQSPGLVRGAQPPWQRAHQLGVGRTDFGPVASPKGQSRAPSEPAAAQPGSVVNINESRRPPLASVIGNNK